MQRHSRPANLRARLPARMAARLAAILLLTGVLLAACAPVQPDPAPGGAGSIPASPPPAFVTPDAAGDWQRIRESGRLVVGTAADDTPFEYYDGSFQLSGYDPALLRAIGAQLGVEVLFKDIAFEGLADALRLGQIDVAAAALTATPEQARIMDFSRPYFAATEGIVARADQAAVTEIAGLAGRRIGVEQGSIYETWLRNELADAELSPAADLILYTTIDAAAIDLADGRIDLLVTDLPVAKSIAQAKGLQVAASGFWSQQYAFGIRKGAVELRAQLDAALAALAAKGTLAQIAAQELGMEPRQLPDPRELPDSAAPGPSAAEPACVDGLAWLEDLSLPDLRMTAPAVLAPGQTFTKTWRVLNTGTCAWDSSYALVFAYGSPAGAAMGGRPTAVNGVVEPGASYTIAVSLVAPVSAGIYQGAWQMQNSRGGFGERMRVGIQVAGAPTPTPAPTQTPAPGITFAADAERVQQGSPVNLAWNVQDAQEVYFYQAGQDWGNRAVTPQGSAADVPSATTTYNLRVVRNGQEEIRSLTVYVEPNPNLPQVDYFTLAPSGELALGACITLAWKIDGEVDQAAIFRNKELLWEEAPLEGTYQDCPHTPGAYEYAVGAQGPGGRNYAVGTLQVVEPSTAAKHTTLVAVNQGPRIDQFAVLPGQLFVGGCAELRWTVAGEATSIRIERSGTTLMDGAPVSGAGTDCPVQTGLFHYKITASDKQGRIDDRVVEVRVTAPVATAVPLAAAAAPTLAASPAPEASGAASAETPVGQEYVLISYKDEAGDLAAPLTGTRITARFGGDGTLVGDAGCNQYSSAYQIAGEQVTIAPLAPTEKFCSIPLGIMDQEQQYLSALQTAATYNLTGDILTLSDGAGNPVAVFVPTR